MSEKTFHQFVKIGRFTIVSGFSGTRQDLPPFAMTEGRPQAVVVGINRVGLKRNGFSLDTRNHLKQAFQLLFLSRLSFPEAIAQCRQTLPADPAVDEVITFIEQSKRGIQRSASIEGSKERSPEQSESATLSEV